MRKKNQMFVLDLSYKSLQFPTFLRVHPSSSAPGSRSQTREAVAENVDSWKGRLYARNGLSLLQFLVSTQMKRLQIMVSIDVSVKHCSYGIYATFAVSFRLVLSVEHEPEYPDRQPQQPFLRVIGNQNVSSSVNKNCVFLCILTIAPLLIVKKFAPPFSLLI